MTPEEMLKPLRVVQLDALELDDYVDHILDDMVDRIIPNHGKHEFIYDGIKLVLKLYVMLDNLIRNNATYGMKQLQLEFPKNPFYSKYFYVTSYILQCFGNYLCYNTRFKHARLVYMAYKLLSVLNFVRFLQTGSYPHLIFRFLSLQLQHPAGQSLTTERTAEIESTNRELLWHACNDMFSKVLRVWRLIKRKQEAHHHQKSSQSPGNVTIDLLYHICSVCDFKVNRPHALQCGHVFCYYCAENDLKSDDSGQNSYYLCPICAAISHEPLNRFN